MASPVSRYTNKANEEMEHAAQLMQHVYSNTDLRTLPAATCSQIATDAAQYRMATIGEGLRLLKESGVFGGNPRLINQDIKDTIETRHALFHPEQMNSPSFSLGTFANPASKIRREVSAVLSNLAKPIDVHDAAVLSHVRREIKEFSIPAHASIGHVPEPNFITLTDVRHAAAFHEVRATSYGAEAISIAQGEPDIGPNTRQAMRDGGFWPYHEARNSAAHTFGNKSAHTTSRVAADIRNGIDPVSSFSDALDRAINNIPSPTPAISPPTIAQKNAGLGAERISAEILPAPHAITRPGPYTVGMTTHHSPKIPAGKGLAMGASTGVVAAAVTLAATGSATAAAKAGAESIAQSIPGVGGAMARAEGNPEEAWVRNSVDAVSMVGAAAAGVAGGVAGSVAGPLGTVGGAAGGATLGNIAFGTVADEIMRGWARHVQGYTNVAPSAGENLVRSAGNAVAGGVRWMAESVGLTQPSPAETSPAAPEAPAVALPPASPSLPDRVQEQAQAARPAHTPVSHDKEEAPTPRTQAVPDARPPEKQAAATR